MVILTLVPTTMHLIDWIILYYKSTTHALSTDIHSLFGQLILIKIHQYKIDVKKLKILVCLRKLIFWISSVLKRCRPVDGTNRVYTCSICLYYHSIKWT